MAAKFHSSDCLCLVFKQRGNLLWLEIQASISAANITSMQIILNEISEERIARIARMAEILLL
jgi:hypothetical protein